jgi:hypothetical protein
MAETIAAKGLLVKACGSDGTNFRKYSLAED